jgi:hypothetical protein
MSDDNTLLDLIKCDYKYIYTNDKIVSSPYSGASINKFCLEDKLDDLLMTNSESEEIEISEKDAKILLKEINKTLKYIKPIVDALCEP